MDSVEIEKPLAQIINNNGYVFYHYQWPYIEDHMDKSLLRVVEENVDYHYDLSAIFKEYEKAHLIAFDEEWELSRKNPIL